MASLSFDDRDLQSSGKVKYTKIAEGKTVRLSLCNFDLDADGNPDTTKYPIVDREEGYYIKGVGMVKHTPEIRKYMEGEEPTIRYATVAVVWNVAEGEFPRTINDVSVEIFGFSQTVMNHILSNNKRFPMLRHDISVSKMKNQFQVVPEADSFFLYLKNNSPALFQKVWEQVKLLKSKAVAAREVSINDLTAKKSGTGQDATQAFTVSDSSARNSAREIEDKLAKASSELAF